MEDINIDDNITNKKSKPNIPPLDESITLQIKAFESVLNNNDIKEAVAMVGPYASTSLYHSSLKALIDTVNAFLTLDTVDIERASQCATETAKLSNSLRRRGIIHTITKMIKTPNYDKYSDLELHAELIYARFLAFSAALSFVENPNHINLFKSAYRIRACMNSYKECRIMYKKRTYWESEISKLNFEAGVRLAHGITHLAISHLPPKVLRLVNFLGVRGVRSKGFDGLRKAAFELPGVSSKIAQICLLAYWTYVEPHGFLGTENLQLCEQMVKQGLEQFPNAIIYRVFQAKLCQITGKIDNAIEIYYELLKEKMERSHKISHWELLWCYAFKCDWDQCVKYAELLNKGCLHSPSGTAFLEAVFKYTKATDDDDEVLKAEATKLFEVVPTLRIRYVGKTVTPEKVAVETAKKYLQNNNFLLLPEMEVIYQGNMLHFVGENSHILNTFLQRVEKQVEIYKKDLPVCDYVDNYVTAVFYKGVLLKHLGKYSSAQECLNIVLAEEARIEKEFQIPPQAVMEMGFIHIALRDHKKAKKWLYKAINDYSGYVNENIVHLRVYAALRAIGISTDKDKEAKDKLDEITSEWVKENGEAYGIDEKELNNIMKSDHLISS